MARLHSVMLAAVCLTLTACAGSPTRPTPATMSPAPMPTAPLLLFGQSNAVLLRDLALPQSINVVQGGTSLSAWAADQPLGQELLQDATHGPFAAIVVWQGEADGTWPTPVYAEALRAILRDIRGRAGNLPARIIEIADEPSLAPVRAAHRLVAADPGNALIPTADLPRDGVHFLPGAYLDVAQRVYRSLP